MPTLVDDEFGEMIIQKSLRASSIRIRVQPNGKLKISAPRYTPNLVIKKMLNKSREELRELVSTHQDQAPDYHDGAQIGKSHSLTVVRGSQNTVVRDKQRIIITLTDSSSISDPEIIRMIRPVVEAALRREAKSYLPKRLQYLADQCGYSYSSVQFSHAGSRWGSCSSNGTISLNIALMKLPFELIDYVIYHELAHTRHMNHSPEFWSEVAACDPNYLKHKQLLKKESPAI